MLAKVDRARGAFGHRWGITVLAPPGDRPDSVMPGVSPTPGRSRRREARGGVVKQRVRRALDDPNVASSWAACELGASRELLH